MQFRAFLALTTAGALISTAALAQEYEASAQRYNSGASINNGVNYTYAEIRYIDVELDNNIDGDGFILGGSYRINNELYVKARYTDLDLDFSIDGEALEFTGGLIFPYQGLDLAAEFSLIDAELGNQDDTGWALAFGGRKILNQIFEARAFLRHSDVLDNSDTSIELGGDYFLQRNIAVGVTLNIGGDTDELSFGGRYFF